MKSGFEKKAAMRKIDIALVSLIALLYRATHLFFWAKTPYFRTPSLDEIYHHGWAKYIADGHLIFPTAFFRAPLYPYFLGAIYSVFGNGPLAPRIIQMIIGVIGCLLVARLAARIFDDRRIGLLAGIFLAVSPMPALFESRLLLDWLLIPLGAASLLFLMDAIERGKARHFFLFGILSGFFAITRPNILVVFPIFFVWLILEKKRKWLKIAVFALLGFALPILPVYIHNTALGDPVIVATQGGLNLFLGNNPETDGITPVLPGFGGRWTVRDAWQLAEQDVGATLSASEMDRYYLKKTIRFALDNPGLQLRLIGLKTVLLFSPIEHGNNGSPEFYRRFSPPLYSPFAWGFFLVLTAAGLPFVMRVKKAQPLVLWGILYSATIVLFFVNARFRLPLLITVVPIAAACVVSIADLLATREYRRILLSAVLGILVLIGMVLGYDRPLTRRGIAESWFALGNIYLREGNAAAADSAYIRALESSPAIDRVNLNRGIIAYNAKDYKQATQFFLAEIENDGDISRAAANLGVINRLESDTVLALEWGQRAIAANPLDLIAYINYARSLLDFGQVDSALAVAKSGLKIDNNNRRLHLVIGAAALNNGDLDTAKFYLHLAADDKPSEIILTYDLSGVYSTEGAGAAPDSVIRGYALFNLGYLSSIEGDFETAISNIEASLEQIPDYPVAWAALGSALERSGNSRASADALNKAIELGLDTPEIRYNLGLVYAQGGDFSEALRQFQTAYNMDSTFVIAHDKIHLIKKLESEGEI